MAEKSAVKAPAVTDTVVWVPPAPVPVDVFFESLPQATSAIAAARLVTTDTACLGVTFICLLLVAEIGEGVHLKESMTKQS
jgi:hypothetical protein